MRFAILFGAALAAGALEGILAYGISHMKDIGGLENWRWLFLLEGLPIIPLGVMTYLFLGSIPDAVQWLDNCEKQLLTNLLREDAGLANSEPASSTRLSWRQVRYAFIDWRIYLYVMIAVGDLGVMKCLTTYLPELVKSMSDSKEVHLMTIPLYFVLENDRRIYLSPDKYKQEAAIIEPCDWHPDIRYVL
ncbi:unnamed protein product [Rotaria sordida]|uniref:Major facilitator superfamily (MFS) profile domain-containing protein n=1 Tax=Rotaria sordida TaxID=392033 RepID=A0A814GU07_9BILA|nr:unnamed protein product [Rotaria sordida]